MMEHDRLGTLIIKFLREGDENLSESERIEVYEWLDTLKDKEEWIAKFSNKKWLKENLRVFEETVAEEKNWNTVRSVLFPEKQGRIRRIPYSWISIAASILAATIIFGVKYAHRLEEEKKLMIAQSLVSAELPGGNRATLILNNGSTILLDSAINGKLADQGHVQVRKSGDGKISYNSNGSIPEPKNIIGETEYNTLLTPRGGQYYVQLSDGSRVWLNAASSIRYPTAFTAKTRDVELTGEGYFEIAKDPTRPFNVKMNDLRIEVLGTHFNVKAYSDEPEIKTTLLEGSVKVSALGNGLNNDVIIKPGQQAKISENRTIRVVNVDTAEAVSWKNGITSFAEADIKTIMRDISRWYDVDVVYEGSVPDETLMGGISRTSKLSEILEILKSNGVQTVLNGKKLIVKPYLNTNQ